MDKRRFLLVALLAGLPTLLLAARPDTVMPSVVLLSAAICEGDTLWVNGRAYHAGKPKGTEVIPQGAANGCDSVINVNLSPIPSPFFVLTDTLCPDEAIILNGTRYDRDNPDGLQTLPGASYQGCDSLVLVDLHFRESWIYAGADQEAVLGDEVCVEALFGQALLDYSWTPPPPCTVPSCTTFCRKMDTVGAFSYVLQATDVHGCALIDTVNILATDDSRVFIPNVFSPEAAEPNNRFFVGADKSIARIRRFWVADRWGALLFWQEDVFPNVPDVGWDGYHTGKRAAPGAYLYFVELERIDGGVIRRKGTITLL